MTRDDILDAAAQIFREKGFHAASMQDIAQAVNLQKASLYHHVNSKQEILVSILDRALDLLIERMQADLIQPMPPDKALRQAMRTYLQAMLDHRDLAAVLLLEHRSLNAEYKARHMPRRDRFERMWRDLIQSGLDAGVFCCTDPAIAARALLGVMNWTITWYRPDGSLSSGEIAEQFSGLFLHGLLTRPGDAATDGSVAVNDKYVGMNKE
ncbi:MAG TPA: TetR/AcrR family transcriptional regulator [Anaerolineales bacterium]|nr:TetR/AcrR family transcriptional regulator [Anaerolineales bacterium]